MAFASDPEAGMSAVPAEPVKLHVSHQGLSSQVDTLGDPFTALLSVGHLLGLVLVLACNDAGVNLNACGEMTYYQSSWASLTSVRSEARRFCISSSLGRPGGESSFSIIISLSVVDRIEVLVKVIVQKLDRLVAR